MKRTLLRKISDKAKEKLKEKKERTNKLHKLFLEIWDERANSQGQAQCLETGWFLPRSFRDLSTCFHHVLEKSKYPEYALEKWNIVIVFPYVHERAHLDLDKCLRIKQYRLELLEKLDL